MDLLSLLRTMGALGVVLGILGGALWAIRRYDIKLPGRVGAGAGRRVELIERLPLDARRSVALIRRDGREHLILVGPEGATLVETGIVRDELDAQADAARAAAQADDLVQAQADAAAMRESFATLVDRASGKLRTATVRGRVKEDASDA